MNSNKTFLHFLHNHHVTIIQSCCEFFLSTVYAENHKYLHGEAECTINFDKTKPAVQIWLLCARVRSVLVLHSSASNRQSNFEDTALQQFYGALTPPHPWCCPVKGD